MSQHAPATNLDRRDVLKLGGAALAAATVGSAGGVGLLASEPAGAQTPKRGGTLRLALQSDPVTGFDPHQTISFLTMIPLSFSYSRLVKVKAGPAVKPMTYPIEPDLAEAWEHIVVELGESYEPDEDRTIALITLRGKGRVSGIELNERATHELRWREGKLENRATESTQYTVREGQLTPVDLVALETSSEIPIKRACCSANSSPNALYMISGTVGINLFNSRAAISKRRSRLLAQGRGCSSGGSRMSGSSTSGTPTTSSPDCRTRRRLR